MPEQGYCEISCITAFESPAQADRNKPNTLAVDAHLFGCGPQNSAGPMRIRLYNSDDLSFDEQGTLVKTDLRIGSFEPAIESTSETFTKEEYIAMGDAKTCTIIEGTDIDPTCLYARFVMTGTVESVQQDPPSFNLNIPQYLSAAGRDARPVLYLKCQLGNSKMWKDPKSLLPYVKSVVSCAGTFSHYEWETRNGKRIARLSVDLDSIEFIAKTNSASTTTPIKNETKAGSVFAKSRYAQRTGSQSPSPASKTASNSNIGLKRKAADSSDDSTTSQSPGSERRAAKTSRVE